MSGPVTMPRVSAITIFLNGLPWLAEAIDSVLGQSYRDFELILVDDGSSDGSSELARDYASRNPGRVHYVEHPAHANRGMSASRNAGASVARGEFIAFIDADDAWPKDKLARQVELLDRHADVALIADAALYWRSWEGGDDWCVVPGHVHDAPIAPPQALLNVYPLGRADAPCPSAVIVRSSAYQAVGGFEASYTGPLQMYEDQAFLSKIYLRFSVLFTREIGLFYRQHDRSCVAENIREGRYDQIRQHFLTWLQTRLEGEAARDPAVRRAIARALWPYRHPWFRRMSDLGMATGRRIHSLGRDVWRRGRRRLPIGGG